MKLDHGRGDGVAGWQGKELRDRSLADLVALLLGRQRVGRRLGNGSRTASRILLNTGHGTVPGVYPSSSRRAAVMKTFSARSSLVAKCRKAVLASPLLTLPNALKNTSRTPSAAFYVATSPTS